LDSGADGDAGVLARRFTAAARRRADPAVLMHFNVLFAFLGAPSARKRTRREHLGDNLGIIARSPHRRGTGSQADIRTIQIEPNALSKGFNHVFAQTSVRARCADLRAGVALLDTEDEDIVG